uniref:DUF3794 domain-containing protein n=1 Tax=Rhabditophanes sp. KR3021 TaxID=114890 RepID=A0AC35TQ27_9BILA
MDKMKFDSIKSDKIKFIVEEKTFPISSLAVKNAIFMKIHRTPSLNSFITIEDKVNVAIHTKMSVDVPCVHLSASHSFANPVQLICANVMYELPSYATGKRIEDSAVCQMEIGSYLFDTAKLNLNWDQVPIVGESLPCSNENWPKCLIEQIHTIKHKTHLFDDEHNDLVACFLLNIRRVYRNT